MLSFRITRNLATFPLQATNFNSPCGRPKASKAEALGVSAAPIAAQTTSKTLAIHLDLCDNHCGNTVFEHGDEEDSHAGTVFPDWNSVI
jgi:hypothetical protein